jgi:anti-sigma-K factor RskA
MRYQDPQLRRMLAAQYVLGTLRGRARRRFERLAASDAALRAEQHAWEVRLAGLAGRVQPVEPRETVWIGLQRRIERGNTVPLRPAAPAPKPARSPLWRVAAGMAAMVLMAVAMIVTQRQEAPAPPPGVAKSGPAYVAELKVPDSTMQWTVRVTPASGRMSVVANGDYPQLGAHSMELWWISPQGPVAIGLLPTRGRGSMDLPKELSATGGITLAVSLEPVGGSPTGKPTGPVLTSGAATIAT